MLQCHPATQASLCCLPSSAPHSLSFPSRSASSLLQIVDLSKNSGSSQPFLAQDRAGIPSLHLSLCFPGVHPGDGAQILSARRSHSPLESCCLPRALLGGTKGALPGTQVQLYCLFSTVLGWVLFPFSQHLDFFFLFCSRDQMVATSLNLLDSHIFVKMSKRAFCSV